ncbi:E3 ubiquitin-protein ligase rad18 [Coniochaeta pulveracea]|uniref:Postreplication repair E3 ubiquitin-protein ligase RAD18 n=1 Tax=Coniochaeta pulveracea TaxID=177199 RepID=A0A420YH81_9PEZI|nr:E3 ubiquitin-protein ligase rad18 [Coniochaeta pulveracea]
MGPHEAADAYDVPDSTDWMGTPLAGLMPVEAAFRCHVCKDFYNSPMITSCNHTFCSLCIRRCLQADGKCPLCRKNDQETKLRGNWALREAVDAFVASRAPILEYARKPAISATASPKRKARELSDEDVEEPTSKRTRMSTRSSARRGAEATSAMAQQEADGPDHEEPADVYTPDDGLVACPICQSRMKEADINKHLDTSCAWKPSLPKTQPSTPKKATSQANLLTTQAKPSEQAKAPERLPALAYSMLKDQALRKKLMELGINSYGSRAHLERRHREWVTLWNANCDSSQPKTRNELLQDLDNWERTVGTGTRSLVYGHQAPQVKDKNFDGSAWASKHDDSFKDLIANARKSKQKAEDKAKESASPAPYPPQLVKAESSSDQQTSSTMVSMAERNAGGGFETEKAVLAERWQQPAPNLLPRSYGEFPYSTVADNDFVRNGRPGHEPEPTTEESAARIGSVTSIYRNQQYTRTKAAITTRGRK